jgi:hypothetical protein
MTSRAASKGTGRVRKAGAYAIICLVILLGGCGGPKPPKHDCPITALVLDASVFPPGSNAHYINSPLPRAAWASAGRTIDTPGGVANHDVYQLPNPEQAAERYAKRMGPVYALRGGEPWTTPLELTYRSTFADQYCVRCRKEWDQPLCVMQAQYEEYYVLVTAHMSDGGLTYADLEKVLRAVDEKMAACLGKPLTPVPTPTTE